MKLLFLLLLAAPLSLAGDLFGVGARLGIPLTDAFQSVKEGEFNFESATKRFTGGPSAELFLPFGFGLEADLLYKRTEVEVIGTPEGDDGIAAVRDTVGVWEIPLLAKYRFPGIGLRPYVSGGAAYRNFGDLLDLADGLKDSGWGFVLGGGLEIKVKRLRISPELRFIRWGSGRSGDAATQLKYSQNQADFLIGIIF